MAEDAVMGFPTHMARGTVHHCTLDHTDLTLHFPLPLTLSLLSHLPLPFLFPFNVSFRVYNLLAAAAAGVAGRGISSS